MTGVALASVVASALMHALYNSLIKTSVHMVSVLFAVRIGVVFLREPYGVLRVVAGLLIVTGVVLISTG